MGRKQLKNAWRKLDNTAKVFSLADKKNINIFRYSVILKEKINMVFLKRALELALNKYSSFQVKLGKGLFWNYLEFNDKDPIVKEEDEIPCNYFNFKENNDYLFRVTYYQKKINLDIFHILMDGAGAIHFLKALIYNYLNLKYHISEIENDNCVIGDEDLYLKCYDRSLKFDHHFRMAYQIPGKITANVNHTYHYIIPIERIKKICKKYKVTITEYLTALYIYAMYLSIYDKKSNKEISIIVPVNLRKYYGVDTLSNFFVCMNVNARLVERCPDSFEDVLERVQQDFREKLHEDKVKGYLTRDVQLGMNMFIRLVPLFMKKIFMKGIFLITNKMSTSTLSNVGIIDIDDRYKKYIDNVLVLVLPEREQKIKCTVCSFAKNLNVTINSNIDDLAFQYEFYQLLKKQIQDIKLVSNHGKYNKRIERKFKHAISKDM